MTSWWWSLWMLLFIAANARAVCASARALRDEHRAACARGQRKRPRGDSHGPAGPWPRASVVSTAHVARAKRRCIHREVRGVRRQGCSWHAFSFRPLSLVGGTHDKRVAAWLAHPLVASAAARLRDGLQSALQEVLVSCISFALCAFAVVLLRRYSTLVVGVSVDLGAFSLEV